MKLESTVKSYTFDQDKVVDPKTTVSDALAKLHSMADLTTVELCERQQTVAGAYSFNSRSNLLNASGKGLTAEQARASAVMELAERYSWIHYDYAGSPGYTLTSYRELVAAGQPTVGEEYFLSNFAALTDRRALLEEITAIPLRWVRGFSLTLGRDVYYPINWHNMVFTSNGLAAGNRQEEAILQALCEVIERECVYRLFVEKRVGNDIDPSSITHPALLAVLESSARAGLQFVIKDISSDLGVPTIIVRGTTADDPDRLTHQGVGHGCHPDPEKALIRAFSEYFEGRALLGEVPADAGVDMTVLRTLLPELHYGFHTLLNAEMLTLSNGTRRVDQLPHLARADIKEEIETLVRLLAERGYQVVVVDKTHPPLGIPVVRVVVPRMRNCINNEITSPESAISEVYHEAGNSRAAMQHLVRYFQGSPFFSLVKRQAPTALPFLGLLVALPSGLVYQGDYRTALQKVGALKKGVFGSLDRIGNIRKQLDAQLAKLGPR
jgi:ribosomal protein S12 methylthiotransferase accessory factor